MAKAKAPRRPAKPSAPRPAPTPEPTPAPAPGAGLFGELGPVSPLLCRVAQKELAAALGVAPKTVWEWGKERAFPPAAGDGYVLRDVIAWLAAQMLERGGASDGETLTLKEKNLQMDTELKRLKRDIMAGDYVKKGPCCTQVAIATSILMRRLQAVGAAFGAECTARLRQAVDEWKVETDKAFAGEDDVPDDL